MGNPRRCLAALLVAAGLSQSCLAQAPAKGDYIFERVPLYQLTRMVLGEVSREAFVVDSALIGSEEMATLDVRNVSAGSAREVLRILLADKGYELERRDGVTFVKRKPVPPPGSVELEVERLIYRPKFRTVAYLTGATRTFVHAGRYGGSAASGGVALPSTSGQASGGVAGAPQPAGSTAGPNVGATVQRDSLDVFAFEGPASEVRKLRELLPELDRPQRSVVVKAVVLEVGNSESQASAVSLAISLLNGKITGVSPAAAAGNALTIKGLAGVDAVVSVLRQDARFKVVSSPTLLIRSGDRGRLSVGAEVPVLGAVSQAQNGSVIQSVSYRSSGVIFELAPTVLEDSIAMNLHQQVSSFVATTTGVNASPTLLKRELETALAVRSGEVVLLGGLDESRDSTAYSGPGFWRKWLGTNIKDTARAELLLVLETTVTEL